MTKLESILERIVAKGKIASIHIDVRDAARVVESTRLDSLIPELVYGPKTVGYVITIKVLPDA